jgi:hypothetical protein
MDPSTQLLIAKIAIPGALGVAGIIMLSRYFSVRKRQAWPTTEGQVVSAEIAQGNQPGRRGKTFEAYWAEVKFSYSVNGKDYQNDRIAADRILFRSGGPAKNIVQLYHPEQPVEVWYNPDDPQEGYLVPGGTVGGWGFLAIASVLLVADAGLTWWFLSWS